jgi:hypothetical protein
MRRFNRYVFIVVAAAILVGCRQADGPVPVADAEVQNRLGDITRDLMSVASRQPDASKDLSEDLRVFAQSPEAEKAATQLASRLAGAVPGSRLNDQAAQRIAHNCWTALTAQQMSQRQVETLQNDMEGLLASIGVAEQNAHDVAAEIGQVQNVVTERRRRWYEVF